MNFTEILGLFQQGKGTARSHIKNLLDMAIADGRFEISEHDLLRKIARRNNVSEAHIKKIQSNPALVEFKLPDDPTERFHQYYDLVHMMTVDKSIHEEEMKLCNLFAVKFGYQRTKSDQLIKSIQSNIHSGHDYKETMMRVKLLIA